MKKISSSWLKILLIVIVLFLIVRAGASGVNAIEIERRIEIFTMFHPNFDEGDISYLYEFFKEDKSFWDQNVWTIKQHIKDENEKLYNKLLQYNEKMREALREEINKRHEEKTKTCKKRLELAIQ
jgi:hypothetical protein